MTFFSVPTLKQDGPITKNSSSSATSVTRASNVKERQTQKPEAVVGKSRAERWKLTGVVALHDCDLKVSDYKFITCLMHLYDPVNAFQHSIIVIFNFLGDAISTDSQQKFSLYIGCNEICLLLYYCLFTKETLDENSLIAYLFESFCKLLPMISSLACDSMLLFPEPFIIHFFQPYGT